MKTRTKVWLIIADLLYTFCRCNDSAEMGFYGAGNS